MSAKETIVLSVETDSSKAEGSVKSLKAQLREAQADVGKMADKFGETSTQAVQAAKRAAELKDRIGDAKALTDAFNPDKKFQAFSSAIQGVVGGFTALQGAQALFGSQSKELEETLVKVQGAMALSQGLSAITEAQDSFKNLKTVAVDAFKAIKGAIGASGIGLLLIALGTIYAYWDDIKEAVNGVSAEQKKLLENQKKSQETAQKNLDAVSKQENILKLQGKSERDILNLKIAGTKQVIASLEAQVVTQENIKKTQIETAKRNADILQGVLRFLTAPLSLLLKTVDKVGSALGQDFGLEKGLYEGVAKLVFDPKKVEENANKTIEETKAKLTELKNQQAGFQLEIKKQDEDAAKKKKDTADKSAEEIKEANKKANEDILKLQQENTLARIKDDRNRAEAKLEMDLESAKKEVESSKASAEIKAKEIQALEEKYMLDLNALKEKNRLEDEKKAKENLDKQLKAEEETFKIVNEARINQIKDQNIKRQELEATRYQNDIDNLYTQLNNKEITEADFNARMEVAKLTHETNLTAIEKQASDERQKKAEEEHQKKVAQMKQIGDTMSALTDVVGKETAVGKALAIAQATINTYLGASEVIKARNILPEPAGTIVKLANVAAIIASGIKSVKAIASTKVPGVGGGGGSIPSMPSSAPIAPQMSQTALNQQMINQVGNAATRAFVLESDVSGNQERIRRLNRAARIN